MAISLEKVLKLAFWTLSRLSFVSEDMDGFVCAQYLYLSMGSPSHTAGPRIFIDDYHPSVVFDTLLHPK